MDPLEDKRAEQRKQVWGAAQSMLGCGGMIALLAGVYWLVGRLPYSVKPGPQVITFIEHGIANNSLFWMLLVGTLFFFLLLGTVKTTLGVLLVCVAFFGGVGLTVWNLYSQVASIAFSAREVELRYVWPRAAQKLGAADILSASVESSSRASDDHPMDYKLHLRTRRGDYETFNNPSDTKVYEAMRRIEAMRKRP